ncbi:bifunctional diaminohydroxyphosphoribosylaminopyrimidine deaminase/5-amino-6-(5-phosphoribosylamino)uracil reductase RibD [Legionella sp. MW5194]|uniref:bifunctional diaminohydroxyphosphoribosylaminopyrimidine deaminase/5-amino-6-(5-phosphoribosylamino)uracil reductase RibD n=1 Tax=Legionella sp. MW5194 TaxID=2662448 RepID=UPI00193CF4F6|nr:bifunctional diaminohydroxyphosphoribosylaminopyrimidine deaminase/5-amino-6-(5-phosphoribosylamino)uracil reductase RibD [Legionella sp. MW5194]QRN03625.1 bifunctional diaminohydroxyphosphoribosylaminopyrimidine deaminase/5-amino-6-(5-phosphoribosylamino)uracil reductase RibD [Legionella sp. MW5194]
MHNSFMLKALDQARLGKGFCAPNPSVGAVAVRGQVIIAAGYHAGPGKPHAEQEVLKQLSGNLGDVTLYVTLEPCNHWGKTPPCVEAIIQAGVGRVVYGFADPNPLVAANNTPALLRQHGIEVMACPLPEIDAFYQSYSYWTLTKKPWVTAKIAQSLDGKIGGPNGERVRLSNDACAEFTHTQRLHSDILLTTAKTVRNDNPRLDVRLPGYTGSKPIAILDRTLGLTADAAVFTTAGYCHVFHDETIAVKNPFPRCTYHAISSREGRLDLSAVIARLGALGYHDVWVEAGGRLFSALHEQYLVNTTLVYLVPEVLGESAGNGYHGGQILKGRRSVSWLAKEDNMILRLDWLEK